MESQRKTISITVFLQLAAFLISKAKNENAQWSATELCVLNMYTPIDYDICSLRTSKKLFKMHNPK